MSDSKKSGPQDDPLYVPPLSSLDFPYASVNTDYAFYAQEVAETLKHTPLISEVNGKRNTPKFIGKPNKD